MTKSARYRLRPDQRAFEITIISGCSGGYPARLHELYFAGPCRDDNPPA
jgi:hypothetical protein